jgi:CBS domain-containing protein
MLSLDVASVMTRDVLAVAPDTSLETAARLLARHHIGGMPVIDPDGRPLGMLSQNDLTFPEAARSSRAGRARYYRVEDGRARVLDDDRPPGSGVVDDIMSPFVVSVSGSTTVREAARLMLADNVHRLLVVEDDRLVGLLSTLDVLRAITR